MSREYGGRGLASTEDSVDTSRQRLEDFIEKCAVILITDTRNNTDDTKTGRTKIIGKQKWGKKSIYGRFIRLISDISHEKTWTWPRNGNLKRETESLLSASKIKP